MQHSANAVRVGVGSQQRGLLPVLVALNPQAGAPIAAPLCPLSRQASSYQRAGRKGSLTSNDAAAGRVVARAAGPSSTAATSGLGLFPAGMQTARVQLPAVVLQLEASKVLADGAALDTLSQALQGGCNMVVLWDSNANAAAMYDAALRVQEALRARAPLLLVDRTDIALAIGAQGVLLTDQGKSIPVLAKERVTRWWCGWSALGI